MKPSRHTGNVHGSLRMLPVLLVAIAWTATSLAQTAQETRPREIVLGRVEQFPPYFLTDDHGVASGFFIDALDAMGRREGFVARYVTLQSSTDYIGALESGRIDAVAWGVTDLRSQTLAFTPPVQTFGIALFVRHTENRIRKLDDLAHCKVGVVEANQGHRILQRREGIRLTVFSDVTGALFGLLSGQVDCFVYPRPIVEKLALDANVADRIKVVGEPLQVVKLAFGVLKENTGLHASLSSAVAAFRITPEYGAIYARWFGKPEPYWSATRIGWTMGAVALAVLVAMGLWHYRSTLTLNRRLRGTIASRDQLEAQLRRSQRLEAVGQLTGGIAHDFNNILSIMMGNAELLGDRISHDQIARVQLRAILGAVDRASALTHRLLAFSRQQALAPVESDIAALVHGLGDMLKRTLGETIDLRIESAPELWDALIDPHQFENALVNLVLNARDAMPGGGTLIVETANVTLDEAYVARHEDLTGGDYVQVSVSDTGGGMSREVLEKVFEPFFTTKEVGKGTGLGLSMVYGFVKQSNGHVRIYSEEGHGTVVKLYLPRAVDGARGIAAGSSRHILTRGVGHILVVEDDEELRKIAVIHLRDHGYEVTAAANGGEAMERLRGERRFELLFTDVVLPGGMKGTEIAEQATRLMPSIKVLYTTGYTASAVVHQGGLDAGIALLNKPYRRADLLEKVQSLLEPRDA